MHCTKCVHFGAITIALQDVLVCIWDLGQIWIGLFHHFQVFATIMYTGVIFSSILLLWGLHKRKSHHFLPWLTIRGIQLTVLGVAYLLLSTVLIAKLGNFGLGPEWNSMGNIMYQIFWYATYPWWSYAATFLVGFLTSIGINPNQLYARYIRLLTACGLIFAIYVAAFSLVKSEWNNVKKHKRLPRLQECRNAIKVETMANDPEVAIYFIAIFIYSLHWVLRPASVTGFEVVKANGGRYIKWISAWYSDQTVAKSNFGPVQS